MGKEDLRLVQPMLQALKSSCETEIAKYEDLVSLDIQDYIFNKLPVIDMRAKLQDKKKNRTRASENRTNKGREIDYFPYKLRYKRKGCRKSNKICIK